MTCPTTTLHLFHRLVDGPPDLTLLDDDERAKCARFVFERNRAEYAAAHSLVRQALSRFAPVEPEAWRFRAGPWGKPEIASPTLAEPLYFNLTHTRGLVACVVGAIPEIGIDAEWMDRRNAADDIARRFFAPAEYEWLLTLNDEERKAAFFRIWTLKESYIKAKGMGLSLPLDSFWFRIEAGDIAVEPETGWSFFEFQPAPGHQAAVAARAQNSNLAWNAIILGELSPPSPTPNNPVGGEVG